jgi:hypothetical protein
VTLEQIERFLLESIDKGIRWRRIRLIGGEPTVHPQLLDFVRVLLEYKRVHSPKMLLAIHTNGYGNKVEAILNHVPREVKIVNTSNTGIENPFYPFNLAPRDSISHHFVDYSMGCRVPEQCGTGLTPFGYYPAPSPVASTVSSASTSVGSAYHIRKIAWPRSSGSSVSGAATSAAAGSTNGAARWIGR